MNNFIYKKMKNKILTGVVGILILSTFISCDKYMDIDPQQSIGSEYAITHEGMISALNGAYSRVAGPELFAGTSIFHSDLLADDGDVFWAGTFIGYRQMSWKLLDPNEGTIASKWLAAYRAINSVNTVLENLDVVNENERTRVEGEAKFIRGIMYYHLVQFYALPYEPGGSNNNPGVPLVLGSFPELPSPDAFVSRSTVDAVYTQVLNDLTDAKSLLEPAGAGGNRGLATGTVASAFLSRVHLTMGNFQSAAEEADIVINQFGGENALNDNPRAAFNNDNYTSEDVFMIRQNINSNAGAANDGIATFFASLQGMGRGDMQVTQEHIDRYEEGDSRGSVQEEILSTAPSIADVNQMYYIGVGTNSGGIMSSKWGKFDANINVIRLAEMFLTRAEANFENGSEIGAPPVDDINVIRRRAGLDDLPAVDRDDIRRERRLELAWEGHRLHDLKRWEESLYPGTEDEIPYNSPRLVLPIPQREIDVNDQLEQNPGY
jgi:starch-binding outer membrane protein, SusD/RagB family